MCAVRLVGDGVELGVDAARRADGTFAIAGQLGAKLTIAPGTPSETALVSTGGDDGLLATFAF